MSRRANEPSFLSFLHRMVVNARSVSCVIPPRLIRYLTDDQIICAERSPESHIIARGEGLMTVTPRWSLWMEAGTSDVNDEFPWAGGCRRGKLRCLVTAPPLRQARTRPQSSCRAAGFWLSNANP